MQTIFSRPNVWRGGVVGVGLVVFAIGSAALVSGQREGEPATGPVATKPGADPGPGASEASVGSATVAEIALSADQQRAIALAVEPVTFGTATALIEAPGQVLPDETKYGYITPRAAGVVRSVAVYEGQRVRAGDLLATIDSPDVARARFDLYTHLQELELAKAEAAWQATVYDNTLALLERLKAGASPDEIHAEFRDRPVGTSREKLITAYADQRLAEMTLDRSRELHKQGVIPAKQLQQTHAAAEAAEATYKSLTEQMEYDARVTHTRADQALKKAETAVRVDRERLRVLGVRPDGTEPPVKEGKVVGVTPEGPGPERARGDEARLKPEAILPPRGEPRAPAIASPGIPPGPGPGPQGGEADRPVSAYSIWAPFDGTILDREMMVPGVYVDMTHRIFTLADLSTVWVEAHVHEKNYGLFAQARDARVRLTSPAYPGREFEAEVIYRGDVVDPGSRTLRLLARAQNPDRLLKPGMFVDVAIRLPSDRAAAIVPASAVLAEGAGHLVFVRTGPERFERRSVVLGVSDGDRAEVVEGLRPGEAIVVRGGFKLKASEGRGIVDEPAGGRAGILAGDLR